MSMTLLRWIRGFFFNLILWLRFFDRVSRFRFRVPGFWLFNWVSGFWFRVPWFGFFDGILRLWFLDWISGLWFRVSGFRLFDWISWFRFGISRFRFLNRILWLWFFDWISGFRFRVSGFRFLDWISGFRFRVSGFWFLDRIFRLSYDREGWMAKVMVVEQVSTVMDMRQYVSIRIPMRMRNRLLRRIILFLTFMVMELVSVIMRVCRKFSIFVFVCM